MSQADWFDHLSHSIREHETERRQTFASLGRYRLMEELGRGGMGVVYHAFDPQLGREVALKVLLDQGFATPEARERFVREAQVAARLSHPNIIPVFDTGEHEGRVYLAMQFVEGTPLDRARLGPREAVDAVRDAARAVHAAHEEGIIHRDIKPANLMVDRGGRVYVTDFGLARRVESGASLTLAGTVVGTPAYMPPEQAFGRATDARSDVYALGATLYEVLTGKPPFSGATPLETLKAVTLDEPLPPRRHDPRISNGLEAVILKAMDKKPEGRYATAAEFADDLDRWLRGEEVKAPVRGTLYRIRKKAVRHRWRVISAALSFLLLSAVLVIAVLYLMALQHYRKSHEVSDLNEKKRHLEEASIFIPEARRKLAAMIESEREAAKRMAAEKTSELDQRKAADEKRAARVKKCREEIRARRLPQAREILQDLRRDAPEEVESLLLLLRPAEFDEGLKELDRLIGSDRQAFKEKYGTLAGEEYLNQPERDRRLAAATLRMGRALVDDNSDLTDARDWLDRSEKLGPAPWTLFEARALARIALKEWEAAEVDYATYRKNCPGETPQRRGFSKLMIHRAREAAQRQLAAQAFESLREAARIDPQDWEALHLLGLARFRVGGSALEALNDLDVALRHKPDLGVDKAYVGICAEFARKVVADAVVREDPKVREGAWSEALERTQRVLKLTGGDSASLLHWQARLRRGLRDYPKALEDAKKAGENPEALLLRGQILFAMGTPEALREARALLARAMELDPENGAFPYWRARCSPGEGGAERDLQYAVTKGFTSPDLYHQLARLQFERKDAGHAGETATIALSLTDANPEDALSILGERDQKSPAQAWRDLRPELYYFRALARFQLREYAGCRADCSQVLDLRSPHRNAQYLRGYASYLLKDYPAAIKDFDRLIETDQKDGESFVARGTAWRELKELNRAIQDYTEALSINPRNPEAFVGRAGTKLLKGDRKGAKEDFDDALKCAPKDWPKRQEVEEAMKGL